MKTSLLKVVLLTTIFTIVSGQSFYPQRAYYGGNLEYQQNPYIRFPQQSNYYQTNYKLSTNNNENIPNTPVHTVHKSLNTETTPEAARVTPSDDVVTIYAKKDDSIVIPQLSEEESETDDDSSFDDDKYAIGTRGNFKPSSSYNSKAPSLPYPAMFPIEKPSETESAKQTPSSPARDVAYANNRFTLSMLNVVKTSSLGNYVFSPFSLASIMAMLSAGANGKTLQEIQEVMSFPENQDFLYKGFQVLHNHLNKSPNDTSYVSSNRLFIQEGIDLKEEFQATLKEKFYAPAQQLDFSAEDATRKINKLVAEDTKQQIPNLIEDGILNNKTRLVALNALYFKGNWENVFHGRATKTREFYKNGVDKIDVDMMNTEEYFKVANIDFLDAKAVVLPYVGGDTEMIIVVPNKINGLGQVETAFESRLDAYTEIIQRLNQKPKNIVLHLPRFSLQSTLDLQRTLNQLGIKKAFLEYQADFSKITGKDLYLSKILQKAFLNVNEAGTLAGAASYGAVFTPLSIGPAIEDTIVVNRPFMGFIRNVKTNLILFAFRKVE